MAQAVVVSHQSALWTCHCSLRLTFGDLLSAVDLGELLLDQLVALLADVDNLGTGHAEVRHGSQDLFGDLGGGLVLGESIGVVEGVVCRQPLALLREL